MTQLTETLPPASTPELLIEPFRPDYAQLPIEHGFDWTEILDDVQAMHGLDESIPLYLVVFRSQLKPEADVPLLLEYDHQAHEAAKESPALLHYFGGIPDAEGRALSFCLWSDPAEAKTISRDARHKDAARMISMYVSYALEKYDLFATGSAVTFVPHP